MRADAFDFTLPDGLIAQTPAEPRDSARLLVVDRAAEGVLHRNVRDLPELLRAGDLLVVNTSRVIPARLFGSRASGGRVEVFLLRETAPERWEALMRPGKRLKPGEQLAMPGGATFTFEGWDAGTATVHVGMGTALLRAYLDTHGATPLPPYIAPNDALRDRYQTVYAREPGSVAAPTAGLHFTPQLLDALTARGVERAEVVLHVGLGTFQPLTADAVEDHVMHREPYEVPSEAAERIGAALRDGRRIVAVGTTSVRVLESAVHEEDGRMRITAGPGETQIFITPGYRFKAVGALLTNFHLPRTTLLMLVSAFAGRERVLAAYDEAIRARYRFYSFGDAMLCL